MPELERWKDRVELSIDGRQIFFLFFGTAVAACLIFVAGVFVGRRIEQRAATPFAADDPLAALDQLDSEEPDDGLTFHEALVRDERRRAKDVPGKDKKPAAKPEAAAPPGVEPKPHTDGSKPAHGDATKLDGAKKADATKVDGAKKADGTKADAAKKADGTKADGAKKADGTKADAAKKADSAKVDAAKKADGTKADGAKKAEAAKPDGGKKIDAMKVDGATKTAAKKDGAAVAKGPAQISAHAESPSPHFTLQLSSFADEGDADSFAQKIRGAGYKPSVVRSEVPGKGTFYRVRVGDFSSRPAADQARADYEHKQHAMVYVAPL